MREDTDMNNHGRQLYDCICEGRVYTLKDILTNYHLRAFWFYLPEISKITDTPQTGELISDWWGNLCCTVEDNVASLKSIEFLKNEVALQSIPCYRCDLTVEFDRYARNHTEDANSWAIETRKLAGLCVFDMDYFEEFLQKNCPIAYSFADTYILLKDLQEIVPVMELY